MNFLFLLIILFCNYFGCILCNNKYFHNAYNGYDSWQFPQSSSYNDIKDQNSCPKILYDNPFLLKFQDGKFFVTCNATGNPMPKIKWFIHNLNSNAYEESSQIIESALYEIVLDNGLQFSNISPNVSANYFCSASNVFGTALSRKSEVPIIFKSTDVKIEYETTEIMLNEKAVFECFVKPNILMSNFMVVQWQIKIEDRFPISISETGGRFSVINVTKVPQLHVRNVTRYDFNQMQVKCVLVNRIAPNNIIETNYWVRPKEFIYDIYNSNPKYEKCNGMAVNAEQGSSVELPWCSYPTSANVMWYKSNSSSDIQGQPIAIDGHKFILVSDRYRNLLITTVVVSDEGFYFVKKDSMEVLVEYKPFQLRVKVKMRIVISPSDVTVAYGSSVVFSCRVTGQPVTGIFWLHNGGYEKAGMVVNIDTQTLVTNLTVAKVTEHTAGVYQCVAESRDNMNDRVLDTVQQSASIIINEMPPRLVSQTPPVLSKEPYATIKLTRHSTNVKVQCSFNATPKASIQWYVDDERLLIDKVTYVEMSKQEPFTIDSTLFINMDKLINDADLWKYGGMLVARATNSFGTAQCKTLAFIEGVLHIRDPGNMTVKVGQKWSLKCYVVSSDVPEITWIKIKDGKSSKFPDTHLEKESSDRREITIESVAKSLHEGSYQCSATVGNKHASMTFMVKVSMPPMVIKPFDAVGPLDKRDYIDTRCQPEPSPDTPWYAWWELLPYEAPDNRSIIIYPKEMRSSHNYGLTAAWPTFEYEHKYGHSKLPVGVPPFLENKPNSYSRILGSYNESLHMAILTCVIQNSVGSIRRGFTIMNAAFEFAEKPPNRPNALLGSTVVLNCSVQPNHLNTSVLWKIGEKVVELYDATKIQSIYRCTNGTLVIRNISTENPLEYLCFVTSTSTSKKKSTIVKINLQIPAEIVDMPALIKVVKGKTYNLSCNVIGDKSNLTLTWHRKENSRWRELVTPSDIRSDVGNTITVLSLLFSSITREHSGTYKCVARNIYNTGPVEKTVQLEVVAVPGDISITSQPTVRSKNMSMSWAEPLDKGNQPIIDYQIILTTNDQVIQKNVTNTSITIDGLRPAQNYVMSISARNGVGLGKKTMFQFRTNEAPPDGPVLNLEVDANSSTRLVLRWKPPEYRKRNAKLIHYLVCFQTLTREQILPVSLELLRWPNSTYIESTQDSYRKTGACRGLNVSHLELTGLPKFTRYVFRVAPYNSQGLGPFTYANSSTLEDNPDLAPAGIICIGKSTTIDLQWNPPPFESINGILLNYHVKYFMVDYFGRETELLLAVLPTKVTLSPLMPYSNYTIQVAATNRIGRGPWSAPVVCETKQGTPSPPDKVKVMRYNHSCDLVVWAPPLTPNGLLTKYYIGTIPDSNNTTIVVDSHRSYYKYMVCRLNSWKPSTLFVTAYTDKPSKSARARVDDSPIVSIPRNVSVFVRSTVVLDCETLDDGRNVSVTWYHYPYSASTRYKVPLEQRVSIYRQEQNGSLLINVLNDACKGIYQCQVSTSNSINYTVTVRILPLGAPPQPKIYYYNISTLSVSIFWKSLSAAPVSPITKFLLSLYPSRPGDAPINYTVSSTYRSFNISNLACSTTYKLILYAVNAIGQSQPHELSFQTLGTRPGRINISDTFVTAYSKALCFQLSALYMDHDCPPVRYKVSIWPRSSGIDITEQTKRHEEIMHKDLQSRCTNVSNLNPSTEYEYKVEAINNAGSSPNMGYSMTLPLSPEDPTKTMNHRKGNLNLFQETIFYVIVFVAFSIVIIPVGILCYCLRRNYMDRVRELPPPIPVPPVPIAAVLSAPSSSRKNIRLPETPRNTYDSGMESISRVVEVDDELQPYSTYAPGQSSEAHSTNPTVQKGQGRDLAPYNAGSLVHAYQYPNIDGSGPQQPSTSMAGTHQRSFDNSLVKQPLLTRPLYNKGYNVGHESHVPLIGPPQIDPSCQEQYRASDSILSSTTTSSTKELAQVFQPNYNSDLPIRLREQDEDNCSTISQMNPSAYLESVSSGDDPGIQMFTQERYPGPQVIEPRFTHPPQLFVPQPRMSSSAFSNPGRFPVPTQRLASTLTHTGGPRFTMQDTLTEEEESNNYQNQFVIV